MSVARQSLEYAHKSTVRRHVGLSKGPNGWLLFQRQFSRDANGECVRCLPVLIRLVGVQMLSRVSHSRRKSRQDQELSHSFINLARQAGVGGNEQEEPSRLPI